MRMVIVSGTMLGLLALAAPSRAYADAAGGVLINHTLMQAGSPVDTQLSSGFGAEFGVVGTDEPYLLSMGGFFATAASDGSKRRRNVYDLRFGFGLKPPTRRPHPLVPFIGAGLDLMYVSTLMPDGKQYRGPTVGFSVRGGVFGVMGAGWIYQVSLSYVGAVAPGIHDGVNGAALQLGIGRVIFGM